MLTTVMSVMFTNLKGVLVMLTNQLIKVLIVVYMYSQHLLYQAYSS